MIYPPLLKPKSVSKHWLQRLAISVLASGLWQVPAIAQSNTAQKPTSFVNTASFTYTDATGNTISGTTNQLTQSLVDPAGQITGCAGEVLSNYQGFSVGVYNVDASGLDLAGLVPLTQTEVPDLANNGIPPGMAPNRQNSNPYALEKDGRYNFLLDDSKGQLTVGKTYILVVNPPPGSSYAQRRLKLAITGRNGTVLSYTATSLDGKPISTTNGDTSVSGTLAIENAEQAGLVLAIMNLSAGVCDAQEIQINKSGDRASAQPGDTVIYRLSVRNLSSTTLTNLVATDTLPLGFDFLPKSVRAELAGSAVAIAAKRNGSTVTFSAIGVNLLSSKTNTNQVLNIAYAARLTPDAIRGSGRNSVMIAGQRADNLQPVKDGPAVYRLRVSPGLLSDCGTIIGRVFIDRNFDGEQQPGEPGVPNAVIFLDDGNRITTDVNGLFSIANVIAGHRTGVLDLTAIPGYTLAPNHYFSERNSQSRLVNLEPGGLVRMNFAVTPAAREAGK